MNIWELIKTINVIKTIWFNFRVFPLRDAIKFPVWLYGSVKLIHIHKGCIKFNCPVRRGLLRIGCIRSYLIPYYNSEMNYLNIRGIIEIGGITWIGCGAKIAIGEGALLKFGKGCSINNCSKVFVENRIELEDYVRASWEIQLLDSSFHYFVSNNGEIRSKKSLIHIGKGSWIGNRVTIQKNTQLPPYSIVASNSIVNKDFSMNDDGGMYAGIPAKLLSNNNRRIVGIDREAIIDKMFTDGVTVIKVDEFEKKELELKANHTILNHNWGYIIKL